MSETVATFLCRFIRTTTGLLCQIDRSALDKVPRQGPLILVSNHIGSLEVPLLYAHLQPCRMTGLAKIETWDNPVMAWLFSTFRAIPVRRGEADIGAIRRALAALRAGCILFITPEGTRSRHGRLLRGRPGVVTLALHSGVPILPLAHWGAENFSANLKRMKRTEFHIRIGRPFYLEVGGQKITPALRQRIADEIMAEIAALLPPQYRGVYAETYPFSSQYLRYLD